MPQSFAKNLIHLIFATKERRALLEDGIREELHRYACGILKDLESPALAVNSVSDHIHILLNLHRTKALAEVVLEVKRGTSKWIKTQGPQFALFRWQAGYGAFSVSQSLVDEVKRYILNQETHHRRMTFQDEFRELCRRHGLELDEHYAWD